jgi:hypothetical protein
MLECRFYFLRLARVIAYFFWSHGSVFLTYQITEPALKPKITLKDKASRGL